MPRVYRYRYDVQAIWEMHTQGMSIRDICAVSRVPARTIYRYLSDVRDALNCHLETPQERFLCLITYERSGDVITHNERVASQVLTKSRDVPYTNSRRNCAC